MTENKRYYVDKDGDLYDGKTNELLMLNFGYDEYRYVKNVLDKLNGQEETINRLKDELFEARKEYIIDTADISDKPYLDKMIDEERKDVYGDVVYSS